MKKGSLVWLGLCVCALLVPLALSSPAMAAGNEILIGAPASLTGALSPDGLELKWAYEQAVSDWNKKGGIFIKSANKKLPIKLVFADDESEPSKVAAAIEKLVKIDKVDLMLGTHSATMSVPAINTSEKYQMVYHTTTHWPEMFREQHAKWASVMFCSAVGASEMPFTVWENLLKPQDRPKSVALLMEDSPDGQAFAGGFRAHAKDHNVAFAVDEPWAIGAKDYSPMILKMKAKNVDAVLLYGAPTDAITLIRQIKEAKLNVKYLHGWKGTWAVEVSEALGKDANYVICDGFWSEDFPYPLCKDLGQRYTAKFNKRSVSIGAFYGTAQTLFMAIEKAKSYEKTAVRDALRNAEFKGTVMGDMKFDNIGLALFPQTANQWWEGKQMLFYPPVKGGYQLKLAPPWDQR